MKSLVNNICKITGVAKIKYEYGGDNEQLAEVIKMYGNVGGRKNAWIATLGKVKRKLTSGYNLPGNVYYTEMDGEALLNDRDEKFTMRDIPRFPEVQRDLSMLIDKHIQYSDLERTAYETERNLLRNVTLFDVYEGEKIPAGKKSYAMSFVLYDDEKTLTEKDIEKVMAKLMEAFSKKWQAEVRK